MKKITAVVLIIINITLLTGCWDMREINELGLVMAVGIDKEAGSSVYTVTVQLANPSSTGESKTKKIWIGSAEGKTIFDAIRTLSQISSRRIMWAHNNIIIIGESVAKDSITPVIDFFSHNPEVRLKTFVVVAKGDAKQYLASTTGLDEIPGIGFRQMYREEVLAAKSVQSNMLRLTRRFFSEERQLVIAVIDFKKKAIKPGTRSPESEEKIVEFGGAAVFKDDKMIGWLTPEETRGLAWLRNEAKAAIVTVTVPGENRSVSVETRRVKSKIETKVNEGVPSVTVKLSGDAHIVEEDSATNLSMEEFKEIINQLVEAQIAAEIELTLDKVQKEYKSDVVDFGRAIHAQHKEEWNKIRDQWPDLFPTIPVKIIVNMKTRTSSTLQQPMNDPKQRIAQ